MKSKQMLESQGATIISLRTSEHNILSLATTPSQEFNYTHTNLKKKNKSFMSIYCIMSM